MTPLSQMIQLIVLTSLALGAVYFVFYRPTVAQQNRQRRVVAGLRAGDEVVTTSGFLARVIDVREPDDGSVEILLDLGGVTIRARPNAIADRLPRPDEVEAGVPAEPESGEARARAGTDEGGDAVSGGEGQEVPLGAGGPAAERVGAVTASGRSRQRGNGRS